MKPYARRIGGITLVMMLGLSVGPVVAQTRESGPWWPHPVWGADDEAGGSNWITPQKVLTMGSR